MIAEAPRFIANQEPEGHSVQTNDFDIEESRRLKSSLEQKVGWGYNVLAEVDILLGSLRKSPSSGIDPAAKEYVLENELTAACEAVESGRYLWSSYRPWDAKAGEFKAFGTSFIGLLRSGVADMEKKVRQEEREEYEFELKRRSIELAVEQELTRLYANGERGRMFLTISAYPEEVSEEIAAGLGYKPEDRLAKLRFEVFAKGVFAEDVRQTVELSVANGSVRVFQKLALDLGENPSDFPDSASLLARPISLGDPSNYLDKITAIAQRYDRLLENEDPTSSYFCGQKVKTKNYEEIIARQRFVREKGKELVEKLYNLDMELAESLNQEKPTPPIEDSIRYWLVTKDGNNRYLLSEEERGVLEEVTKNNILSRTAAFILKKNELVRMWSVMACLINEEKAKKLFGEEKVIRIQNMMKETAVPTQMQYYLDQMIAYANPQFIACGGLVNSFGAGPGLPNSAKGLFQSPLSQVKESLFGANSQAESRILCCTCPYCKQEVEAVIKDGSITCPKCNKSVSWQN